ncbi:MAG TPA: sigma-70 family RNA polymerase sigma factor, partial [Anaerovoracaceae bacterium]|nr:sigma-70 family RNA polymerase sigma factor [Anaerovoracaceae bacterium]
LKDYQKKIDTIVISNIDDEKKPVTENELADRLNVKPESILPIMKAGIVHLSHLDISSIKTKQMESFTLPVEDKLLISQLMYNLTGLQRDVIEMLFYKQMTQNEVAEELGLTQKQVSRIKLKSLRKMKEAKKDHEE